MTTVGNFANASNPGGGTSTHTLAFPGALTAGSILVAAVRTGTAVSLNSVSDGTQTWTVGTHRDQTGRLIIAYFVNNALTSTPTVTFTFSTGNSPRLEIFEIVPTDLSGTNISFDKYGQTLAVDGNSATSGTSLDGGTTATLAHPNSISIGVFSAGADQTYAAGTGYTLIGTGNRMGAVYRIVSATTAVQALATDGVSSEWSGITAVFQIAADGGGGINTGSQTSSTGYRDTNAATKTSFNFNAAGFGPRDTNVVSRNIGSSGGAPSTGFRATNVTTRAGLASQGSVGFRDTNSTSINSTNVNAGRFGARSEGVVNKTTFNFNAAGFGIRAENSASLAGIGTQRASTGYRAANATTRNIGSGAHTSRFGYRSANSTSRAIAVGTQSGSLGMRASGSTTRAIASAAQANRLGWRSTNVSFLGGTPPTPEVIVPNFAECETDLTLPARVVWSV